MKEGTESLAATWVVGYIRENRWVHVDTFRLSRMGCHQVSRAEGLSAAPENVPGELQWLVNVLPTNQTIINQNHDKIRN